MKPDMVVGNASGWGKEMPMTDRIGDGPWT